MDNEDEIIKSFVALYHKHQLFTASPKIEHPERLGHHVSHYECIQAG
jgi:hypothetical protein